MTTNDTSSVLYVDTSALAKLIVPESESDALRAFLAPGHRRLLSSAVTVAELGRVVLRRGAGTGDAAAEALEGVNLVAISRPVLEAAGRLVPPELRALDAIHLATALQLGSELTALVTYDRRMREAAELAGITVIAPGQTD